MRHHVTHDSHALRWHVRRAYDPFPCPPGRAPGGWEEETISDGTVGAVSEGSTSKSSCRRSRSQGRGQRGTHAHSAGHSLPLATATKGETRPVPRRNRAVQTACGTGGGFGMTPWCDDLVCSGRRLLADRHSLPFPWTLSLCRRWCPSASHRPVTFLFFPALTVPLPCPFLSLGLSLRRPRCPSASHHSFPSPIPLKQGGGGISGRDTFAGEFRLQGRWRKMSPGKMTGVLAVQ